MEIKTSKYLNELITMKKLTIHDLEIKMNKSSKTIVKDLDELEIKLQDFGIKLVRKPGKGIWIECSDEILFEVKEELKLMQNINLIIPSDKLKKLFLIIAFGKQTNKEIADILFISPSTLTGQIQKLNQFLELYNVSVVTKDKIVRFNAKEQQIRKVIFEVVKANISIKGLMDYIQTGISNDRYKIFYDQTLLVLADQVRKFESENKLILTDRCFADIYIHLIICCNRVKLGYCISNYERQRLAVDVKEIIDKVQLLYISFAKKYKFVDLNINERKYLLYIISNNFAVKASSQNLDGSEFQKAIEEALRSTKYLVNYDISEDCELVKNLVNHVRPAITRINNQVQHDSIYTSQIKNDYELSFNIAKLLLENLRIKYNIVEPNDDEIAQIAIHIQASIEKYAFDSGEKLSVCIVSSSGQGIPRLIEAKLHKHFPNVAEVKIYSVLEYYSKSLSEFDVVVATTVVKNRGKHVINISPLINFNDLNKISSYLISSEINDKSRYKINRIVEKNNCLILDCSSKAELLMEVNRFMLINKYVTNDYLNSLYSREKISTTDNSLFAVPHGNPEYVLNENVLFVVNKKPIDWGRHQIKFTMFPIIAYQSKFDVSKIMESIYKLKGDPALIENVINCNTNNHLFDILRES